MEPPCKGAKQQKTISVMKGLEWQAYVLVKDLVWEAVDVAWCNEKVSRWGSDDIPVPSNYEESNYDQHASESESNDTQPGLGGQGKGGGKEEIINKSKKRKKKITRTISYAKISSKFL